MQIQVFNRDYFSDHRGLTYTIWEDNLPIKFVLDKVIHGDIGHTRGFHGDSKTWKLITCLLGSFDLVLLDPKSKEMQQFRLSETNGISVLVPPGIANAHQGLEPYIMFYKWSEPYDYSIQFTINPECYKWKYEPILSDRDLNARKLKEL